MASLRGHLFGGIIGFPIYHLAFYASLLGVLDDRFVPSIGSIAVAYILFIIGSDLPDIDSSAAPIRWFAHSLVPLSTLMIVYKIPQLKDLLGGLFGTFTDPALVAMGVMSGFGLGFLLGKLKHRGFLHTNAFGLVYGLLCYALGRWGLDISGYELLYVSLAGFFGVFTHLLLDYKLRAVLRWFNPSRAS